MAPFTTVYIDPRCRVNYASYYILGLMHTYGKKSVKFDVRRFKPISPLSTERAQANGMSFMLIAATSNKKTCYVDFHASDAIDCDIYRYVDVYAKVNLNPAAYELDRYPKIIGIGPGFAVDIWSWPKTLYYLFKHLLVARKHLKLTRLDYCKDHLHLKWRRKPLSDYFKPIAADPDYLFSMSTLWYDNETAATTNALRGQFFRTAQKYFAQFEGGFFYVKNKITVERFPAYAHYLQEYQDCIYQRRIRMASYIEKTKRSAIVFNTPSVSGCLGWKLGEYLCMGKAIVSSPLKRVMPGHTQEFAHFITNGSQMEGAIGRLKQDEAYRQDLERKASAYFQKYLTPKAIIQRIADHIPTQNTE